MNTYFDTRGSYRRTAKSIGKKLHRTRTWKIVDKLGQNCKNCVQVAEEFHPKWSGFLGLDGKTVRIKGEKLVLLLAVDLLGTQDIVDAWLAEHEDYYGIRPFIREINKEMGYNQSLRSSLIGLDQAWEEAVSDIYPDAPILQY